MERGRKSAEARMCYTDESLSPSADGSLFIGLKIRERSPSPVPNIQKALFKIEPNMKSKEDKSCTRKRSSRPSLEDDIKKVSNSPLLGPDDEKENVVESNHNQRYLGEVLTCPSAARDGMNVFRFSTSQFESSSVYQRVPKILVHGEDDVFDYSLPPLPPASSKLLLTPSTAHTPRYRYSSSSSLNTAGFVPSPSIDQGVCCNTPSRKKLEADGLGSSVLVLGRGAYGTVVLGQWKGRKVAIKVMEKEVGNKSSRRRKSIESELQARDLDHENVVKVFGVHAEDDRHAVIIMEYVGSRNLHRLLVEMNEKYLGSSWLIGAARQVSSAISHCHSRGVIHLDIKPANILVTSMGVCKLGDFGCSVSVTSSSLTMDHSLVGTPGYQAPEFLRGGCPTTLCDVYSLAILMWQLDSREVPFCGQHPQTVMFRVVSVGARPSPPGPGVASVNVPAFTSLYKSCWDKRETNRPSAQQVVDTLDKIIKTKEKKLKVRTIR